MQQQSTTKRKGILERLAEGPVIGDGGFLFALEKRGYVIGGAWTAEVTVEHPDAVRQLHKEFLRSGSDVMQAFTYFATDDKLESTASMSGKKYTSAEVNQAACTIARQVADEGGALVAGGITCTRSFNVDDGGKEEVRELFRKQVQVFVENKTDFIICEFIFRIDEMELAIGEAMKSGQPVAASMCIGPQGDYTGVSPGQCAVRMAKAGASVVGVNCNFDFTTCLKTIDLMKTALEEAGLSPYLIVQPHGYHTPDVDWEGYTMLPEWPYAMEARVVTRVDMHQFAREAYNLGVRYIGGCCGTEPYHIRAMAEELSEERGGRLPAASKKELMWGGAMALSVNPWLRNRVGRNYWSSMNPATGRPFSPAYAVLPKNKAI